MVKNRYKRLPQCGSLYGLSRIRSVGENIDINVKRKEEWDMNPVADYIKNLGKSVSYAAIQHMSEKAPALSSFAESNQELYKEVFHSVRDYKTTVKRAKDLIQGSTVYRLSDLAFGNAMEDIKSGNLYNKKREDSSFGDFGDTEDMSEFDNTTDTNATPTITDGDQMVIKAVNSASEKNAYAVTNAVANSAEYIAGTAKSNANMQYTQSIRLMNSIQSGFGGLSNGIDALYKFNTEVVSAHAENSKRYFESTTGLLQEQNAILKEMLTMQREKYKVELKEEKEKKANRFDDVVNASGTPDLKAYGKAVGGNFVNAANEASGGMLGMLSEENLKMFANNPLAIIPQFLIASAMGPKLTTALKKFDDTLSGAFATMTAKFNKNANDDNANPLEQFLGKIFGLKNTVKSTIDTSKYEQGNMQWNGIANKSLIEVIPGHLRRIEALIGGTNERFYDLKSGKWTNAKAVQTQFNNIKKTNVQSATSDMSDEMKKMMEALSFKSREDKEAMHKDMETIFTKIYDDFGHFDPNSKDESDNTKYGIESKANMKLFKTMFSNLKRGTAMKSANNIQSQREMHNRQMEGIEKDGNSLYGNLFNGYNADSHIKTDDKTGIIKEKYGNLGDQSNILKVTDPFKKNIFDYLRGIQGELFAIRKTNGFGCGSSRGGKSGKNKANGRQDDFSNVSDEELKKQFERTLGPKEKSNAKIEQDRTKSMNDSFERIENSRYNQAKSQGKMIGRVDRYMDDTSEASGAIRVNASNRNVRDNKRSMENNSTWLTDMIATSAKDSKKNLEETADKDNKTTFLNQLIRAGSLGAKYDVIRNGIDKLTAKPADILTGVISKADENIYNFFYGQESDVKDKNGNKIKGFFNRMSWELQGTFGKINDWMDNTLLKPFKDKFGGESMWKASKNALKGMGVDIDGITKGISDYFVGKEGILTPTIDAVKNAYNQAYEEVKKDMKKSYKDADQFYNNKILGEQTTDQKIASAKRTTGVDAIDEVTAFKHTVKNNKSVKRIDANTKERQTIANKLKEETNPKKISELQERLDYLNSIKLRDSKTKKVFNNKIQSYTERKGKIQETDLAIQNYNEDDSELLAQRNGKIEDLNTIKSILELPSDTILSKLDLSDPKYSHLLKNKRANAIFSKGMALEHATSSMKTGREKLEQKRSSLQREQDESWKQFGTTKDKAISDPNIILSQAEANKKAFTGNATERKSFTQALDSLATLLGLATSDPEAKVAYKKVDELSAEYMTAVKGLGKGDPLKSIRIQINQRATVGKDTSDLTNKMNDIIASKGALYGRYTEIFSDTLGKMSIPEEQISTTVQAILDTNSVERLKAISESFTKFVASASKANPSIAPYLESYKKKNLVESYTANLKYHSPSILPTLATDTPLENFTPIGNKFLSDAERGTSERGEDYYNNFGFDLKSNPKLDERQVKVNHFAQGARNITKSGLSIVSEGEAIIPSDENPFNPNKDKADRRKDEVNERNIKQRLGKVFDKNDIAENANGTPAFGQEGAISKGVNNFKNGIGDFANQLFDTKEAGMKISKVNAEVKKHLPKGIAGGLLGGTVGLLTGIGGPLLGAIAGSALSVVSNSETFQKGLFGEKVYDAEGNDTGKRGGGLFSDELQESMSKYLPDAKTYGITGTVLGMLTPLGPLGGLMMGSAISFAKNNEGIQNALFGEKDGLINGDSQKLIQKAFPNVAAAAIGTMFLGPFGLLGNAALGTGLGLVSTTDEFKDFMLGKADSKGVRKGGLSGALRETLIDPLAGFASTFKTKFFDFMKKDMLDPIKRSIAPIGKQISLAIKDTFKGIGKAFGWAIKSALGIPLVKKLMAPVKAILKPVTWAAKKAANIGAKVISAPSKAIGWVGDKVRQHQIEKSNADYMTADERLEFMAKRGKDYKLKGYDENLSNSSKDDLEKAHNLMGELKKGKGFLDERHAEYVKDLGSTVTDKLGVSKSKAILKAAHAGDMEKAQRLIQESDLSTAEKAKLSKEVNVKSNKVREMKARKENYTGNENELYAKLEKDHGIKGINADNLDKYRSVLQTEIQSRDESKDGTIKEGNQFDSINSSLDANTDKLAMFMKEQVEILAQIRDNAMGINPKQQKKLDRANKIGDKASEIYTGQNNELVNTTNESISKAYDGQKISEANKNVLADNPNRFQDIKKLAYNGYKFKDLDKILSYDANTFKRFIELGQSGYEIKDYDKLAKMSDEGFGNILAFVQTGMKITNMDAIMNEDPEVIKAMVELFKGGFNNVSQDTLKKMAPKKSQYLGSAKDKAIDKMYDSTNEDDEKAADNVSKVNGNNYDPRTNYQKYKDDVGKVISPIGEEFSRGKSIAKTGISMAANDIAGGIRSTKNAIGAGISSIGASIADKYKTLRHPSILPNGFADGATSITKGGVAVLSKGEQVVPANENKFAATSTPVPKDSKSPTQVNTEYGIESYTKSTDGSMVMANSKDNKAIQEKISDRDNTQKGILTNLKIMAGVASGKLKVGAEAAKSIAKGGLAGALSGLLDLVKLPMTMLKSFGSLLGLPLQLLGLGGVGSWMGGKLGGAASWVGNKLGAAAGWAGNKLGGAAGWAGNKLGGFASKIKDKIIGTKLGGAMVGKLGALSTRFGNSKIGGFLGKGLTKGKSLLGKAGGKISGLFGGGDSSSAVDGDGNAVDEPTDLLAAMNTHRTTMVSYLQQIIDLLKGGAGVGDSSGNPIADAAQEIRDRSDGKATKAKGAAAAGGKPGALSRAGSFISKHKGKLALAAGAAAIGTSLFSSSKAEAATPDNSDAPNTTTTNAPSFSNTASGLIGGGLRIVRDIANNPEIVEKAQAFIAKAKDALKSLVEKVGKFIPSSKAYTAVQEFCGKLLEKMAAPKNIAKIVEKLGAKLSMAAAYATVGAATAGIGDVVLAVGEAISWFWHGWSGSDELYQIKSGSTAGMKFVAGFVDAVVNMIPILGYVIQTDDVLDMALGIIGPPCGFTRADVEKLRNGGSDSTNESQDNKDPSENKGPSGVGGFFQKSWNSAKDIASNTWDSVKNFAANAWDSTKKMANNAWDSVKNGAQNISDKVGNAYNSAKNTVATWMDKNSATGKTGPKFGRGAGTLADGFHSQLDPANAMNFNTSQDSTPQTMEDSGCGPVSATNMASALGVNIDPKSAAKYALSKGYKEKDGGTEPGYFGDILGKYGIGTEQVQSPTDIKSNLSQGNPVLLMGKDNKGVNNDNPYGQYNHYVVGTGMDGKGNITVQDPESTTPDKMYKASSVLGKSSMAIAAGKGKFGRGNKVLKSAMGKLGTGKWGRGTEDNAQKIWNFLKDKKMSSEAIAGIMGNIQQESSFDPTADNGTHRGICQWDKNDRYARMSALGDPNLLDTQLNFMWQEMNERGVVDKLNSSKSIKEAAEIWDTDFEVSGGSEMGKRVSYGENIFNTIGQGKPFSGSATNSKTNNKDTKKKNTGFFGQLSELAETMSNAFNLNSSDATTPPHTGKGKWGRGIELDNSAAPGLAPTTTTEITKPSVNTAGVSLSGESAPGATPINNSNKVAAAAQTASSDGMLGGVLSAAKSMTGKMQQALGPLAGAITSQAGSFFGADKLKMIFGDDNPFSSIFGSKDKKDKKQSDGYTGEKFVSNSTNAGIQKASTWAEGLVESDQPQGYGPNGCTAFAKDYIEHSGNEFANSMPLWTPTLMEQAKASGLWKDASKGGAEGDIGLINTDSDPSDPDHVVIADGKGGYFGNSSSTLKVKHGPMADTWGDKNIFGYVATGAGDGSVVTGNKTNGVDTAAEAGPGSASGKSGLNKFGTGKTGPRKFGTGTMLDQIKDSIKAVPEDFIQDYNKITDDDSMDVAKAKAQKIKEMWDAAQAQLKPNSTSPAINLPSPEGIAQSDLTAKTLSGKQPISEVNPSYANALVKEATKNTDNPLNGISTNFIDGFNNKTDTQESSSQDNSIIKTKNSRGQELLSQLKQARKNFALKHLNGGVGTGSPIWGRGTDQTNIESITDSIDKNIIDPNIIKANSSNPVSVAQAQQDKSQISQACAPDYSPKLDMIISLLASIAGALTGQTPSTQAQTNTTTASNQKSSLSPASILSKLSSMGNGSNNGFGDIMATKDTQSIISAMRAIAIS